MHYIPAGFRSMAKCKLTLCVLHIGYRYTQETKAVRRSFTITERFLPFVQKPSVPHMPCGSANGELMDK